MAEVMVPGRISNHKGVNIPGAVLDLSPLTPKDRIDCQFAQSLGVDWIALSFVQTPSDLLEARSLITGDVGLLAKIEKPSALERLEDIVQLSDAVMVARGDLGVEIAEEDVPGRQKEIVRACRLAGKPVIVATQMLESMVQAPSPTRAEASDVATAIYDGADAVMLSAETATGSHPLAAVATMDRIIRSTERHKMFRSIVEATKPNEEQTPSHAVATAAADVAATISAKVVVAYTSSGATASRIARKRPLTPIMAVSPNIDVVRRSCLLWGVHGVLAQDVSDYAEMVTKAAALTIDQGFAQSGNLAVIVAGIPFGHTGSTNNLRIVSV